MFKRYYCVKQQKQKYIEIKNHKKMKPKEKEMPEEEQSSTESLKLKELDEKIHSVDKEIEKVQEALNTVSVQITDLNLIKEKVTELYKRYEKTKYEIKEILDKHGFDINLKLDFSYDMEDIEILLDNLNDDKNQKQILLEKDKEKQTEKSLYKIKCKCQHQNAFLFRHENVVFHRPAFCSSPSSSS